MSRYADEGRSMRLDPDSFASGYFRNAVYRHWDPYEDVPQALLEQDRERLVADEVMTERNFEQFRRLIAQFGAGEEAVTEDLAPLLVVEEDVDDQLFLTSQLYEEAKHTQFFDRYWREVVDPVAEQKGYEVTSPLDDRYFSGDYVDLFDTVAAAMHRLLTDDSPENRARAYCHYHLVVESVLAQTGYYSIESIYSPRGRDDIALQPTPHLEGLVAGVTRVRSDEGRHVGFGMHKVRGYVQRGDVDPAVVQSTLKELMPYVAGIVTGYDPEFSNQPALVEYSREKLSRRIEIITEADAEVPSVEELVTLRDDPAPADD